LFSLARGSSLDRWQKSQIAIQSLETGERRVLVDGASDGRYVPTGHLLYALGGVVFARRFDPVNLRVLGEPVPVIEGVRRSLAGTPTGIAQFSVSNNGSLVYIPGPVSAIGNQLTLALLDQNGGAQALRAPPGAHREPRVSPDGKQIAYGSDDARGSSIFVYDVSVDSAVRRLPLEGNSRYPVWSPDGTRIAFQSDRSGDAGIFVERADGSGTPEQLTTPERGTAHIPESWSPDGKSLLFSANRDLTFASMLLSLDDRKTVPFAGIQSFVPINAVFSPDGRWVAYMARTSTAALTQVFVQPFPPTGIVHQIGRSFMANSVTQPFWSRDGRQIYYLPGPAQLAVLGVTTRPAFTFTEPRLLPRGPTGFVNPPAGVRQLDAAPDGRVLALIDAGPAETSGQEPAAAPTPNYVIVLNWLEEVKQRVPPK
jgi:hypothetical protein